MSPPVGGVRASGWEVPFIAHDFVLITDGKVAKHWLQPDTLVVRQQSARSPPREATKEVGEKAYGDVWVLGLLTRGYSSSRRASPQVSEF